MYKPFHLKIQNFALTMEVAKITISHLLYFTLYLPSLSSKISFITVELVEVEWFFSLNCGVSLSLWNDTKSGEDEGELQLQLQLQLQWWGEITMTVVIKISNIFAIGIIRVQFGKSKHCPVFYKRWYWCNCTGAYHQIGAFTRN